MRLIQLIQKSTELSSEGQEIPDIEIVGIESDSRKIKPGFIFVALEGGLSDGHNFINAAIANGAAAIVGRKRFQSLRCPYFRVDNPRKELAHLAATLNGNPARKLRIIGVTGTDGKTTTVTLIHQILTACGVKAGMISTVHAVFGDEQIDTGFHVTTPEATTIQELLKKMVDRGFTHVVLETTSHGLDQYRVEGCEFDIAVVTNITHEHFDYHRDYEGYFSAKFKLIEELVKTVEKPLGNPRLAIVNHDDISFPFIYERLQNESLSKINLLDYGLNNDSEIFADKIKVTPDGLSFNVSVKGKVFHVASPLAGSFNVHNILAAISATLVGLDLGEDSVLEGIKSMQGVPGRMEKIDLGQEFTAIVDFAHTPNALKVALLTAREMTTGRTIAVFGSAGLRDKEKRRMMAAVSIQNADITIMTAEDPRTESLAAILAEMADEAVRKGGKLGRTFFTVEDRGEAIRKAVFLAQNGDLIIACGKGHEQSMCFGETEYLWDDIIAMRAAISEKMGVNGPQMPWLPTQKK